MDHTRDFRHKEYINSTELSVVNGRPRGSVCRLCLTEKLWLLKHFNDVNLLNKKLELISKCRDENKLLIKLQRKGSMFLFCRFCKFPNLCIFSF